MNSADLNCVCTSQPFQTAANGCIKQNCPPSDLDAALALQTQECAASASLPSSLLLPWLGCTDAMCDSCRRRKQLHFLLLRLVLEN